MNFFELSQASLKCKSHLKKEINVYYYSKTLKKWSLKWHSQNSIHLRLAILVYQRVIKTQCSVVFCFFFPFSSRWRKGAFERAEKTQIDTRKCWI